MNIQVALKKWKDTVSIESLRVEDIVEMLDCMAEYIEKLEADQQSVQQTCATCGSDEFGFEEDSVIEVCAICGEPIESTVHL